MNGRFSSGSKDYFKDQLFSSVKKHLRITIMMEGAYDNQGKPVIFTLKGHNLRNFRKMTPSVDTPNAERLIMFSFDSARTMRSAR